MHAHGRLVRQGFPALAGTLAALCLAAAAPARAGEPGPSAELKPVTTRAQPRLADDRLRRELARHRGKPVLLNFWASWCTPCREELPALQRLATRWADRGLAVVTVAVADRPKTVDDLFWELSIDLPVVHDPEQTISRAHGAYGLPTTLLLDRRHRPRMRGLGVVDWDSAATDRNLQSLFH